jgi:hypothetical protein
VPAERVGSSRERIYLAGGNKRGRRLSAGRHGIHNRGSTLRDKIHEMHGKLASLTGEEGTKLSEHIAAEAKELDGLVAERDILAADAR